MIYNICCGQGTPWSYPIAEVNFCRMCPAWTLIKINEKIYLWWHKCTPLLHLSLHPNGWWDTTVSFLLCITLHYPLAFFSLPSRHFSFCRVEKESQFRNKWFRPSQMIMINVKGIINHFPSLIIQRNNKAHLRRNYWSTY